MNPKESDEPSMAMGVVRAVVLGILSVWLFVLRRILRGGWRKLPTKPGGLRIPAPYRRDRR